MRVALSGLLTCVLVVTAGCGGSSRSARRPADAFAYDAAQPLGYVERGRVNQGYPVAIQDVSYRSGRDRVAAFLAVPPERGTRLPAAIFLHGAGGNREEFVVQATWLAGRRAIGLSITAPSAAATAQRGGSALQELRREVRLEIRDVIAVRRAVDLLRRRADVDPARIGFVGWSAGARTGAILAGVEPRLRAIVLMSAGAAPVSVYSARAPAALRPTVRRALSRVDPLRYIRHAKGSALLLQDGRRDAVVPRAALAALARAAPRGTAIRWYDAGHALDVKAYREQLAWLTRKLGIGGPPVKGALTGP